MSAVVTPLDKPKGRGLKLAPPPVKVLAEQNGITVYQTDKIGADIGLIQKLKELKPDFIVTFAFGQILTQEIIDIPKYAVINLHASLLPKYRGANPIQRCIYNGDKKTGICTMVTALELDAGDICGIEEIPIDENMTDIELRKIIGDKAPSLICSTLKGLYQGSLKPKKQNADEATFAKKFTKADGLIDWSKSAECVHNHVRAMNSFPCAYTYLNGKMIKIIETRRTNHSAPDKACASVINVTKDGIEINTGSGCVLVTKVKPENRGVMSAYDFANGAKISKNIKFGE